MASESAPPKHHRVRISLRVVLLLVLVAGVWMGSIVNKVQKQREAVAAVKEYGGWVFYDWQLVNGRGSLRDRSRVDRNG